MVNEWNLQISDKRTTHLSQNTKGQYQAGLCTAVCGGVLIKDTGISREKK